MESDGEQSDSDRPTGPPAPEPLERQATEAMAPIREALERQATEAMAPIREALERQATEAMAPIREALERQATEAMEPLRAQLNQQFSDSTAPLRALLGEHLAEVGAPLRTTITRELTLLWNNNRPDNWPEGADLQRLFTVAADDGIPLTWVPRGDVVSAVLRAGSRQDRINVLLGHEDAHVEDCRAVLASLTAPTLASQLPLAVRAIDALEANQHEAAQALAVLVTDTCVLSVARWRMNRSYGLYRPVKDAIPATNSRSLPWSDIVLRSALAPLGPFYIKFEPGDPLPDRLNRHVTVHGTATEHLTKGNAVIAVLLMTSVLRALSEDPELDVLAWTNRP